VNHTALHVLKYWSPDKQLGVVKRGKVITAHLNKCYSQIVHSNSHSTDEQFLLSSCVIMACLQLLHSVKQWFSTFSLQRESNPDLRFCELHQKNLTQVNSHVLFYCRTKSVTQNIRGVFTGIAREPMGPCPPKF